MNANQMLNSMSPILTTVAVIVGLFVIYKTKIIGGGGIIKVIMEIISTGILVFLVRNPDYWGIIGDVVVKLFTTMFKMG